MEFPFAHHASHHKRQEEEPPPPPPPSPYPPPAHHQHHHPHRREEEEPLPPPSPYPPPAHHQHHLHHRRQEEEPLPPPSPYPPPAHHQHHHHHRRQEEEPLPPPPPYTPPGHHHHHQGGPFPPQTTAYYSPPPHISHEVNPYPHPQPPHAHVQHISHEQNHSIHIPSFIHHHTHITERDSSSEFSSKPTVAVFCKADTGYSLTIRDHRVILAPSNPNDIFQHWIKDEKYSTRVKDEQGFPSFALINKATGQAIKHSIGHAHPVQLISYDADKFDESILWTESNDLGDGYRTIRMLNNIRLNLDAFNGDRNHGGVHEGTIVVLWEWKKGDNQRWKIAPY